MKDHLAWNQSSLWNEIKGDTNVSSLQMEECAVTKKTLVSAVPDTQLNLDQKKEEPDNSQLQSKIVLETTQHTEQLQKTRISFIKACGVLTKFLLRLLAYTTFCLALFGVVLCAVFFGSLQQDIEIIRDFYIKGSLVAPFLCMPLAFYITLQNWVHDCY